jgi:two-component system heavy metal sensor histidine kinase CusS
MIGPGPISLRWRLILLVIAGELLLLSVFALVFYRFATRQWTESFDTSLRANAEALASLIEIDEVSGHFELEFSDEIMPRFSRKKRPELFAILDTNSKVLELSDSLKALPAWVNAQEPKEPRDFETPHGLYRGLLLHSKLDEDGPAAGHMRQAIVFFARSRHDLDEKLEDIREFIGWAYLNILLATGFAAGLLIWRGLIPLDRLARQMAQLTERDLATRFATEPLPPDLRPLAVAFNQLLGRLQFAFERERQFSSDAAHELRTPVATLKSGIQAALLCRRNPAEDRTTLEELLEETSRLEQLCESLLMIGSAREQNGHAEIDSAALIEEVAMLVDAMQVRAQAQGSRIEFHPPATPTPPLRLASDPLSIRRILSNLLENALHHAGAGIVIRIDLETIPQGLRVQVDDNGRGVPDMAQPYLFNRFFRSDAARTHCSDYRGHGLGLALCRALSEQYGGSMNYDPLPTGGSRFTWLIRRLGN